MAQIIDGRALAATIKARVKDEIKKLGYTPGLAALLVGDDAASQLYVNLKERACREVGIRFESHRFSATQKESEILETIAQLNARADIDAVLVQLPLPVPLSDDRVVTTIDPTKDVDGFHPKNLERLLAGNPIVVPGVARGIVKLIQSTQVPLADAHTVILANSTTFALPIKYLLEQTSRHVHIVRAPHDLSSIKSQLANADILVVAIGRANAITADFVKSGAIIIDVGTNRLADGSTVGDIDFASVQKRAAFITPVPGGVGPMTVATLLENVLTLAAARR